MESACVVHLILIVIMMLSCYDKLQIVAVTEWFIFAIRSALTAQVSL